MRRGPILPEQTLRAILVILPTYGITAALAWAGGRSWCLWILFLPWIGGLQNHLMLLHHEGAHGLLHPRRAVNDFLANVFCGFPFFELMAPYRRFHFAHHRHVTDSRLDPEIPFYAQQGYRYEPMSRRQRLRLLLLDLSGYHWLQFFAAFLRAHSGEGRLLTKRDLPDLAFFLVLLGAVLAMGGAGALFWYWLVPQATVGFLFAKLRGYSEHRKRNGRFEDCTANTDASRFARFFVFPLNTHLHLEHHRNPGLPWYRLRRPVAA